MPLSIQVPIVGLGNVTEEPKIANDFTNLSIWANGNVADVDLKSSNNTVRRLILTASGILDDSTPAGDHIFTSDAYPVSSGAECYYPPPMWIGDGGVSSQPPDFQVAGKTAMARVRTALAVSAPGSVTVTSGLYQLTGVGGVGRGVSYVFAGAQFGSTTALANPPAGVSMLESGEFLLPMAAAVYALGVNLSAPPPANCAIAMTCQLYAYNV
jgi:hypothetical protein